MSPARRAVLARSLAVLTLPQGLLPRARAAEFTTTAGGARRSSGDGDPHRLAVPGLAPGSRRLYLCRHGETDWNVAGRVQGMTDIPLNPNGRSQAAALAAILADVPIGLVASSALGRASSTADAVAALHPGARRLVDASFNEMNFGSLEGEELRGGSPRREEYEARLAEWEAGRTSVRLPGGGESPEEVAARALKGLRELGALPPLAAAAGGAGVPSCPRHVCLVAHGRFNKILLAALRGDVSRASQVAQGNTAVNIVDIDEGGACTVVAVNLLDHLRAAAQPPA
ncbi:hypothetical protein EMIHUDRAFT_213567 [Emiliania huxleyi CCMP1516]|uniref:Phosphoglycerate mutase n=2 Tax=Emiliania huxleyi TaxID=2903 RepID=A0A0D3IM71_EMIH1|nr:hypothetical protein EMIHUDRAFT_213567 [Emiliania huxleyi CCMP1516]EOD12356.1 hypothetical protein EMIHUDRAFT_213567 [Emiliania huxleyi CCMP1516]|eukprot:XP_005764785.1 hypothetical protein EMIHUDRAFT_213567 [Emiliania huxleyi CCMP1516]